MTRYFLKDINMFEQMPPQFILWKSVPDMPAKKDRKVPCDATGAATDPHDVTKFMSYQEAATVAAQGGFYVGFVLTKNDPYFLFDLDDVRDPVSGRYTDLALSAAALFPGAAMEVSHSQTGMHIYGRCDAERLRTKRRKWQNNQFEFYTEGRFVALGHGANGNVDVDWSDTLAGLIPERDVVDLEANYDGPVPEYTGVNWTDQELITKMLNTTGSMAAQFGDKASARDLWTCDVAKLARLFASPGGDVFDRSSADAALMAHLAFWTGKDYVRMASLFRESGLMRDKFSKRPDYRMNTITGAIAVCRNVYSVAPRASGPATVSSELMTVQDQQKYFEGVVYVADRNEVMLPHGGFIKPQAFRARFGGYEFLIGQDKRPTTNAFEALTENRIVRQTKADTTTYRPDFPFGQIVNETDVLAVNIYKPPHITSAPVATLEHVKPFLDLIAINFPDRGDQTILLNWLAWVVQNPGKIARWSPVLQGTHGCGKGLISRAVQYCVGDDHTAIVTPENLADNFNGYLVDRCLIAVDEIGEHSKKSLIEISERLKPLISDTRISIRAMRRDARTMTNTSNWFFTTNYIGSMFSDDPRERRWCPFVSALQAPADLPPATFYGEYVRWFDNGGCETVRGFLTHRVVTDFPNRAPVTTSTEIARNAAESDVVRLIREMVRDDAMGFRNGFVSSTALRIAIREEGLSEPKGRWFADHIRRAGFPGSFRSRHPILAESFNLPGFDPSRDSTTRATIYHCHDGTPKVADYLTAQCFPETPKIGTTMRQNQPVP